MRFMDLQGAMGSKLGRENCSLFWKLPVKRFKQTDIALLSNTFKQNGHAPGEAKRSFVPAALRETQGRGLFLSQPYSIHVPTQNGKSTTSGICLPPLLRATDLDAIGFWTPSDYPPHRPWRWAASDDDPR